MTRALRAAAAWAALTVLLVGAPWALVELGQTAGLGRIDWAHLMTTPDTGALLLGVLTLVGWLAWGVFALTVLAEAVALATGGRSTVRLPLTGWARPLAAALVLAAAGALPVSAASAAPGETAPTVASFAPVVPAAAPQPSSRTHVEESKWQTHVVVAGDDLWTIAQHHYGDPTRWRAIARENGLDPQGVLAIGTVLRLPGLEPTTSAPASVVVRPGDTLSALAAEHLGDADRWPEIREVNRAVIADPDVIEPGWRLQLPTDDGPTGQAEPKPTAPAKAGHGAAAESSAEPKAKPVAKPEPQVSVTPEPTPSAQPEAQASTPTVSVPASTPVAEPVETPAVAQTAAESAPSDTQMVAAQDEAPDGDRLEILGGVAGLLALSLAAALQHRRRGQLFARPIGRRIAHAGEDAQRLEAALARRATDVTVEPEVWPPAGVVVGMADDEPVVHDLEAAVTTVITGADEDDRSGALAAALTGLVSAGWSAETTVLLAGDESGWAASLDVPQLVDLGSVEDGVVALERATAARRIALGHADGRTLEDLRHDADTADAWQPQVYLFATTPTREQWRRVRAALRRDSLAPTGVGACVLTTSELNSLPECGEALQVDGDTARLCGRDISFTPQVITQPARRALMDLFSSTTDLATVPAPWWSSVDELPANLRVLEPTTTCWGEEDLVTEPTFDQPTLLVLGPVQLTGATGTEPSRAKGQCLEYAAWIQQNPGRTSAMMNRDLMVADSTRRSNLSRLRTWLGADENGQPYLPDAYTGRIALHPAVGTDWEHLQLLVAQGVDRCSSDTLVEALRLVRGAPLADAAPGSWHWAEEWRTDMVSTIRDLGVVLAQRALASGNLDLARWAAARALKAAPEDELLMLERIRQEHHAGNRLEVDRLVLHLNRVAKILGVDLSDETVAALQEVMEGRTRARFA